MTEGWFRLPADDGNFSSAIQTASLFELKMALTVLGKEQQEGQKHKTRITAVKKEIKKRLSKESKQNNQFKYNGNSQKNQWRNKC